MTPLTTESSAAEKQNKKHSVQHGESNITALTEASSFASFNEDRPQENQLAIPYTVSLPLLVMIDMIGVSLVVPLLNSQYYQLAGVTSATTREWLSSIYAASQILGGLAMGALADSKMLNRHTILLISFLGSAFAYGMIRQGGLAAIVVSRVTVGLVKQTMTITSSILAHSTPEKERATQMGRLSASMTVAWIIGPSAGAYLFKNVGTYSPIYVSCCLFLLNSLIVLFLLPKEQDHEEEETPHEKKPKQKRSILSNFQACFHSNNPLLTSTVIALLLNQWITRTTTYRNISTYYETKYGTQPHQRGYLRSYQSALAFVVQTTLIQPILHYAGGEVQAATAAAALMAAVSFAEMQVTTFSQYLLFIGPAVGVASAILLVSLKSVVSKVAPKTALSSVFATIDVLTNGAMVTVPFYRTLLFRMTQPLESASANNSSGDPDPNQWLWVSGLHWVVATVAFAYLLLWPSAKREQKEPEKVKTS